MKLKRDERVVRLSSHDGELVDMSPSEYGEEELEDRYFDPS